MAGGLFVVLTVSSGLGFYNLSVYMNLLAAQRGFSVSDVSVAVGLFFLVGGGAGLVVGRVLQRRDVRLVIIVGALLGGVALALIGILQNVWQLLLVYAVFGIGNTCVSIIPATTLITRWFDAAQRPIAMSLTTTGLSLGGVVLTPVAAALLARWPLEAAMPLLGVVYALVIIPIAWVFVRSFPGEQHRLHSASGPSGTGFADAVRSRFFVVLTAGYLLAMGAQVGGIAHIYNRGVEIATPLQASFAISVLATLSVLGRFVGGALIGRVSIRGFTFANLVGQLFGFVLIAYARDAGGLWLGAAVFGVTVGNLLMLQPLILAQAYGVADYPRIFALSQGVTTVGIACGPLLLGLMQAGGGGYLAGFLSFASLSALALLLIAAAGPIPEPAASVNTVR
jgi:predicted MFS family arabinose efflux permease